VQTRIPLETISGPAAHGLDRCYGKRSRSLPPLFGKSLSFKKTPADPGPDLIRNLPGAQIRSSVRATFCGFQDDAEALIEGWTHPLRFCFFLSLHLHR